MSPPNTLEKVLDMLDYSWGCWTWSKGLSKGTRYAVVNVNGQRVYVHRYVYEQVVGPVPEGLELDHLCRNRACVRPDHLEPVTHKVNTHRGEAPGVVARLTDTCARGHVGDWYEYGGRRWCRGCKRPRNAADQRRYREARVVR